MRPRGRTGCVVFNRTRVATQYEPFRLLAKPSASGGAVSDFCLSRKHLSEMAAYTPCRDAAIEDDPTFIDYHLEVVLIPSSRYR